MRIERRVQTPTRFNLKCDAHASINRIYRLIFNEALGAWVPVSEITRGRGRRNGRLAMTLVSTLALGVSMAAQAGAPPRQSGALSPPETSAPPATQLPSGSVVVAGTATIASDVAVLTVDQSSQRAIINWNTFNVGSAAQVNFVRRAQIKAAHVSVLKFKRPGVGPCWQHQWHLWIVRVVLPGGLDRARPTYMGPASRRNEIPASSAKAVESTAPRKAANKAENPLRRRGLPRYSLLVFMFLAADSENKLKVVIIVRKLLCPD